MKRKTFKAAAILWLGAGVASADAKQGEGVSARDTTTRECIQRERIANIEVYGERTLLFEMIDGTVWRNTFAEQCDRLTAAAQLPRETTMGELCATDRVQLSGYPLPANASCTYGKFERVRKGEDAGRSSHAAGADG